MDPITFNNKKGAAGQAGNQNSVTSYSLSYVWDNDANTIIFTNRKIVQELDPTYGYPISSTSNTRIAATNYDDLDTIPNWYEETNIDFTKGGISYGSGYYNDTATVNYLQQLYVPTGNTTHVGYNYSDDGGQTWTEEFKEISDEIAQRLRYYSTDIAQLQVTKYTFVGHAGYVRIDSLTSQNSFAGSSIAYTAGLGQGFIAAPAFDEMEKTFCYIDFESLYADATYARSFYSFGDGDYIDSPLVYTGDYNIPNTPYGMDVGLTRPTAGFQKIAYAGTKYYAVSSSHELFSSTDGVNWTFVSEFGDYFTGIFYNSSGGPIPIGGGAPERLPHNKTPVSQILCDGDTILLASLKQDHIISTDGGATWTDITNDIITATGLTKPGVTDSTLFGFDSLFPSASLYDAATNTMIIAYSGNSADATLAISQDDGVTWTSQTLQLGSAADRTSALSDIKKFNGTYYFLGANLQFPNSYKNYLYYSTDLTNFTMNTVSYSSGEVKSTCQYLGWDGTNVYIIPPKHGFMYYKSDFSSNTTLWSSVYFNYPNSSSQPSIVKLRIDGSNLYAMDYQNGKFYSRSDFGTIFSQYSINDWTEETSFMLPTDPRPFDFCVGSGGEVCFVGNHYCATKRTAADTFDPYNIDALSQSEVVIPQLDVLTTKFFTQFTVLDQGDGYTDFTALSLTIDPPSDPNFAFAEPYDTTQTTLTFFGSGGKLSGVYPSNSVKGIGYSGTETVTVVDSTGTGSGAVVVPYFFEVPYSYQNFVPGYRLMPMFSSVVTNAFIYAYDITTVKFYKNNTTSKKPDRPMYVELYTPSNLFGATSSGSSDGNLRFLGNNLDRFMIFNNGNDRNAGVIGNQPIVETNPNAFSVLYTFDGGNNIKFKSDVVENTYEYKKLYKNKTPLDPNNYSGFFDGTQLKFPLYNYQTVFGDTTYSKELFINKFGVGTANSTAITFTADYSMWFFDTNDDLQVAKHANNDFIPLGLESYHETIVANTYLYSVNQNRFDIGTYISSNSYGPADSDATQYVLIVSDYSNWPNYTVDNYSSTDLFGPWTSLAKPNGDEDFVRYVTWVEEIGATGKGRWVTAGNNLKIAWSEDLTNWTVVQDPLNFF